MKVRSLALMLGLLFFCLFTVSSYANSVTAVSTETPHTPEGGAITYLPIVLKPESLSASRRINIPYNNNTAQPLRSILWLGQVDPTNNYADARIIYDDDALHITLHIMDRRLWYDTTPSANSLDEWDAVSVYLDLNGNTGNTPDNQSYRFISQLRRNPPFDPYQAAFIGNGTGWQSAAADFTASGSYVGSVQNGCCPNQNVDLLGWVADFEIPFDSLGLGSRPSEGTVWGLSIVVHDRDSASSPGPAQTWPEDANGSQPNSWGQLRFGLPTYTPPTSTQGTTTIRHGLNGANVVDAHVGGGFFCGEEFNPNFFNGWGDKNYFNTGDRSQINVQNQTNLGDWPCFSKIYITFPTNQIPAGKQITSAELILNHFGNSDPSGAQDSLIHIMTVGEDWTEQTITWNNAPLAVENYAVERISPLPSFPGWPGVERTWDISRAVADAYAAGEPLRLAIYSTDSQLHSGKYFYSSDADAAGRPKLIVEWGN